MNKTSLAAQHRHRRRQRVTRNVSEPSGRRPSTAARWVKEAALATYIATPTCEGGGQMERKNKVTRERKRESKGVET